MIYLKHCFVYRREVKEINNLVVFTVYAVVYAVW